MNQEDSTLIYIKRCKKVILSSQSNEDKNVKSSTPNNEHFKEHNTTKNTHERAKSTPVETEGDRECLKIIRKKDYYDILEIKKEADENEIKKAYRKVNRRNNNFSFPF